MMNSSALAFILGLMGVLLLSDVLKSCEEHKIYPLAQEESEE